MTPSLSLPQRHYIDLLWFFTAYEPLDLHSTFGTALDRAALNLPVNANPDTDGAMVDSVSESLRAGRIREALTRLPVSQREALELYFRPPSLLGAFGATGFDGVAVATATARRVYGSLLGPRLTALRALSARILAGVADAEDRLLHRDIQRASLTLIELAFKTYPLMTRTARRKAA